MGPEASAKLLEVIVDMAAKEFRAKNANEFPEIIVDSIPIPDFIHNKNNIPKAKSMLQSRIRALNSFKPAFFAIACNTAHLILEDLQESSATPFVSIIEEVTKKVSAKRIKRVGILATPVTINSGLFQTALKRNGVSCIIPKKKDVIMLEEIIRKIIAGKINNNESEQIGKIASALIKNGAQGVILGCTELPLVFPKNFPVPVFDSLNILAKALLEKTYNRHLPEN